MSEIAARIAAAAGDASALLVIAIELAQENAQLAQLREQDAERKRKQADRTYKSRNGVSRDVTLPDVTECDSTRPPLPSPSLLPPTPPNNSSSPHTPPSSSAPAADSDEGRAEHALLQRMPSGGDRVVLRFLGLAAADATARISYVGRLGALMDRRPHFTPVELVDGLEAMMSKVARADWGPSYLRTWVLRIRTDETREAEADANRAAVRTQLRTAAAGQRPPTESGEAGAMFARIRALIQTTQQPGQRAQRFIPRAAVDALGERAAAAYDQIGGAQRFLDEQEKVGFLLRDYVQAYGTLTAVEVG